MDTLTYDILRANLLTLVIACAGAVIGLLIVLLVRKIRELTRSQLQDERKPIIRLAKEDIQQFLSNYK